MREMAQRTRLASLCGQLQVRQQRSGYGNWGPLREERYRAESWVRQHWPDARQCALPWFRHRGQQPYECASWTSDLLQQISKPQRARTYTKEIPRACFYGSLSTAHSSLPALTMMMRQKCG